MSKLQLDLNEFTETALSEKRQLILSEINRRVKEVIPDHLHRAYISNLDIEYPYARDMGYHHVDFIWAGSSGNILIELICDFEELEKSIPVPLDIISSFDLMLLLRKLSDEKSYLISSVRDGIPESFKRH